MNGNAICTHNDVITHGDITMDVPSNIITYCDITKGIPGNIITHCDVIMGHPSHWLISTGLIDLHLENTYMYIT